MMETSDEMISRVVSEQEIENAANAVPVNPTAFSGQGIPPNTDQMPAPMPMGGQNPTQPDPTSNQSMQNYLMNKVAEIRSRMGAGDVGALGRVVSAMQQSQPPQTKMIAGQPHSLAYINPREAQMLKKAGGAGVPDPQTGIPAYYDFSGIDLSGVTFNPTPLPNAAILPDATPADVTNQTPTMTSEQFANSIYGLGGVGGTSPTGAAGAMADPQMIAAPPTTSTTQEAAPPTSDIEVLDMFPIKAPFEEYRVMAERNVGPTTYNMLPTYMQKFYNPDSEFKGEVLIDPDTGQFIDSEGNVVAQAGAYKLLGDISGEKGFRLDYYSYPEAIKNYDMYFGLNKGYERPEMPSGFEVPEGFTPFDAEKIGLKKPDPSKYKDQKTFDADTEAYDKRYEQEAAYHYGIEERQESLFDINPNFRFAGINF